MLRGVCTHHPPQNIHRLLHVGVACSQAHIDTCLHMKSMSLHVASSMYTKCHEQEMVQGFLMSNTMHCHMLYAFVLRSPLRCSRL
jgi:hypothetical protein